MASSSPIGKSLDARNAGFGLLVAALAAANLGFLRDLVAFSRSNDHSSHILLVPLVSAGLVLLARKEVFRSVGYAFGPGGAVLGAALVLGVAARLLVRDLAPADALALTGSAVVGACLGGFLLFYGPRAFHAGLFPLLFLLFVIPLPSAVLDGAVRFLQRGSTEAVEWLFRLAGTPFYRRGFVFELPGLSIEVATQCSGIRSSIALLLTSLLAGHLFLRTPWRRGLLAALVVPVTMLKNGIRIVALSLLAIHVDPRFMTSSLHRDGGVLFFLLALVLLAPVLAWMVRSERRDRGPDGAPSARR